MLNTAAKIYLTLAGLALVGAIAYGAATDDRAGWVILWFLVVAAAIGGFAIGGSGVDDRARRVAPDAPIEHVPVGRSQLPRSSAAPLMAAIAAGIVAIGVVVGADLVIIGVLACLVAAGGWLGAAWRQAPGWDPAKGARLSERYLAPLGIPLGAFIVFLFLIVTVSRVLLAVSEHASVVVALVVALLALLVFSLLASRARLSRGVIGGVVTVGVVVLATAGVASAAKGEREFEHKGPAAPPALTLTAKNTTFSRSELHAPADTPFTLTFHNQDNGVYHNVGIYTEPTGGKPIVDGQPVQGVKKITYTWTVSTPGTYTFRCDFHANMVGTIVVGP
jgi:plastocyanin